MIHDEQLFDQNYYGQLNLPLLNSDSKTTPIKDCLNQTFDFSVFIKPSRDQKAFNAGILEPGTTIKDFVFSQLHENFWMDESVVIAAVKPIFSEFRFFVVNQEVITGSQYRNNNSLFFSEHIPENLLWAAKEYAKLYQPHDIFTMDLADTPQGIKIIEYNCWNASGLYRTNIPLIFNTVHDFQTDKLQKLTSKIKKELK